MDDPVSAGRAPFGRRLLLWLVGTVCRFPLAVLLVSLGLCGLSLFAACTHLQYHTQRNDLISSRKDYLQRWQRYVAEFGDDDDIVVVVRGQDKGRMEKALEAIADKVEEHSDLFDRLFYKVDLRSLRTRALLFLPIEQIESIRRNLQDMALLLDIGPLAWKALSLQGLLLEAQTRLDRLAHPPDAPHSSLNASDEQFFTQLTAVTRSAQAYLADPGRYSNPWSSLISRQPEQKDQLAEPQYFFSGDGTLAFLMCRPIKEKGSFTACLRNVKKLRKVLQGLKTDFPDLDFGMTGLPVLETDEMAAAQHDTELASWLASAGVTGLFFLVYRGISYPILTVVTLLTGTAWAMGWTTLTVGHLNILSATFAIMLIGMGDYGVLWVMRYEQARREGRDVRSALLHTTEHVAIGNLTAASTLALAFFAAILADFKAVAELGWIAGCGVLLCALACFTVLPSLLMLFDRRLCDKVTRWQDDRETITLSPCLLVTLSSKDTWLPAIGRRPGLVLALGAVGVLLLGSFALRVSYDHNLLHLQAQDLESVRWEMILCEHTAGASWHALSCTNTPEEALALKARFEQLPHVSTVAEVASLLPAHQNEKLAVLADIQQRLRRLPQRGQTIAHLQPSAAMTSHLAGPVQDKVLAVIPNFKDGPGRALLQRLQENLKGLQEQIDLTIDPEVANLRLLVFDQRMTSDLAEDLHRLRDVSHPVPITVDDFPPRLRERQISKSGKWLLRVFSRDFLWDFEPLEHFTQAIQAVDPEATGKPFTTVEGLKAMKNGLERAGIYAFLVIAGVLFFDFRKLGHTLIALAPLLLGVLMTLGIMGLIGMPLNPANMIAFPLILGVGVDNGVHILHDYLIRRRERQASISYAIGRGVLVKAMTTMIGFGTLMISTERGLAGLGFILTVGVGCSMVSAIVLLPAFLHLLGRSTRRHQAPQTPTLPYRKAA
jgi:hopanoid biosynthesis associated RND transporter like protein HpnN